DLVRRGGAVTLASGGTAPAQAAKAATGTLPIVFTGGGDPVKLGLVKSLGRPGGNATRGLNFSGTLMTKRLTFLRELVPGAALIAVLVNSASPDAEREMTDVQASAKSIGQPTRGVSVSSERELEAALPAAAQMHAGALFVSADPLFTTARAELVAVVAKRG